MELKDFVKLALSEIVEAAKEANKSFDNDAFIGNKRVDGSYWRSDPQLIEFNVAVTTTEADEKNGGMKLTVANLLHLGADKNVKSVNQVVNTIKFTIPLVLQISDKSIQQYK